MTHTDSPGAPARGLPTLGRTLVTDAVARARVGAALPTPAMLALPERAVQFGTGAFLRGFVDAFVDTANRRGQFCGRIVAVGSTGSGRDRTLAEQDGLYTLAVQGIEDGAVRREHRVIASVSRALSARDEWDAVLAVARAPELSLVFSNTTEVGIALDPDDRPDLAPPRSFPGKLARFLLERGRHVGWDAARGVVVVPCELIEDNGTRLKAIVVELAARWGVEPEFAAWLDAAVPFCDTLVDRIVPGAPAPDALPEHERALGYHDGLLTTCEPYRLFAIEGDDALRARLGFADADAGIVVTPDVAPYRERKVRLLNGTHTIAVSLALLAGCTTVREAMEHPRVGAFVRRVLLDETVPTLAGHVPAADAAAFARAVLDRFANPFIRHALVDITLQGTMKMRVRVVPTIERALARTGAVPPLLALGLAAFLLWQRGDAQAARAAAGLPVPADDGAARLRACWADDAAPADVARRALADVDTWGTDLAALAGGAFADRVADLLARLVRDGVDATLAHVLTPAPDHPSAPAAP